MYFLNIEWAGPRYVGPFSFRFQADNWAKENVDNGSWNVSMMTNPKHL